MKLQASWIKNYTKNIILLKQTNECTRNMHDNITITKMKYIFVSIRVEFKGSCQNKIQFVLVEIDY